MTNGNIGMKLGNGNTVANCIAVNNADGIDTGSNCTVSACEANGNDNGIATGANCRLLIAAPAAIIPWHHNGR